MVWQIHSLADAFERDRSNDREFALEFACGYLKGFIAAVELFRARFYATTENKVTQTYDLLWDYWESELSHWVRGIAEGTGSTEFVPVPKTFLCSYCGERIASQRDHLVPISRGGPDTDENKIWSCAKCNNAKGDRTPEEWLGVEKAHKLGFYT